MSDHEYTPKSNFGKWFNDRLPLLTLANHLTDYPTPKNLNYWWTFGGILTFCLVTQIVTGLVLAMHYIAHADMAFDSVEHIMRDVNYGWLIRYIHANGASMFFLAVYIHIFRSLFYGSYKAPREIIWIIGIIIYLLMMAAAFMGYVLPWGQMSFWGATVITNLFSAIPLVGEGIVTWLWGGYSVDNPTLTRFFTLHYLIPFLILGLVVLHIWALHVPGNNNPIGIDVKKPSKDTVPFHPYIVIKDAFALLMFMIVLPTCTWCMVEKSKCSRCSGRNASRSSFRNSVSSLGTYWRSRILGCYSTNFRYCWIISKFNFNDSCKFNY